MDNNLRTKLIETLTRSVESLENIDFHGNMRFSGASDILTSIESLLYELIEILENTKEEK